MKEEIAKRKYVRKQPIEGLISEAPSKSSDLSEMVKAALEKNMITVVMRANFEAWSKAFLQNQGPEQFEKLLQSMYALQKVKFLSDAQVSNLIENVGVGKWPEELTKGIQL